jgi:hypothetical protein
LVNKVRSLAFDIVEKDVVCAGSIKRFVWITDAFALQADGVADESIVSTLLSDPDISRDNLRDAVGTLYAGMYIRQNGR